MIRVLGPLAVDGVALGSARQRRLLAALAVWPGESVRTELLAELVWGAAQPVDPAGAVQTNVARLRRVLPRELVVETTPEGYRLRGRIDAVVFTEDPVGSLGLWRGSPFAELDHPAVDAERSRLEQVRRDAVERHGSALLDAGRAAEAVAALEPLVEAEPLREHATAVLMRALVAAGRQADGLAAFTALRTRLAAELGLDPAPELQALHQQILRQELVPAVRRAPPLPASSFVGRAGELAQVADLLERHRLVTLTGPGGVGKTRLARHVTAATELPDGVLVVELAEGGPRDVVPALAGALRITDARVDRIVEALAPQRLLLVLDNCEHVADEAAALAEAVVAGAPGVAVLATSREPLRIDGEQCLPVAPLGPDDAAGLLADRVRALDPTADVSGPQVAEICRRLDGLPLALELAAGRVAALGVAGIGEALDLRGGRRTAAPRHRSLRDVVAWSYGLLDDDQRTLFDRLSVFAGPVEASAVEAVCGAAGALPDLVERSLVVRTGDRFGMLETLRAFGRARSATAPQARELRIRHAAWAVELATGVRAARRTAAEADAVRRWDAHLGDLRRAHAWLCTSGPVDQLLALCVAAAELGYLRCRIDLVGLAEEGLRAAGVLAADGSVASRAPGPAAEALYFVGSACWQRGELDRAAAVGRALAERGAPAFGHEVLANVHSFRGDLAAARAAGEAARRATAGDPADQDTELLVTIVVDLLVVAGYAGEPTGDLEAELAGLLRRVPNPSPRALAAYGRGERLAAAGAPGAEALLGEAVRLADEVDSAFVSGIARHTLLTSAARTCAAPLPQLRPLLEHWHRAGSWTHLWVAVRAVIEALSRLGRHAEAVTLLGALRASPQATPAYGADAGRELAVERAGRAALGDRYAGLLADGAALGDHAAFRVALAHTR